MPCHADQTPIHPIRATSPCRLTLINVNFGVMLYWGCIGATHSLFSTEHLHMFSTAHMHRGRTCHILFPGQLHECSVMSVLPGDIWGY